MGGQPCMEVANWRQPTSGRRSCHVIGLGEDGVASYAGGRLSLRVLHGGCPRMYRNVNVTWHHSSNQLAIIVIVVKVTGTLRDSSHSTWK